MASTTRESGNGYQEGGFQSEAAGDQTAQWQGEDFQESSGYRQPRQRTGRVRFQEEAQPIARGAVKGQFENRTSQFGMQAFSLASDLRQAAETLRDQGSSTMVAGLAEQASAKIEDAARYIQSTDFDQLSDDLKRLAKQQPWLVAAGLFAVGFGASRVIKATVNENGGRQGDHR
ncbi:MAG: hypothetical protein ACRDIU_10650 [Actinomycetota bacterium]